MASPTDDSPIFDQPRLCSTYRGSAIGVSLWSRRRFLLVVAITLVALAIGTTVGFVNLRSHLIARRNRLEGIAAQQGITLRWTEAIPFRHFYYRFFNQLPSSVADYVQDIHQVSTSGEGLNIPPAFFHDLNGFDRIERISWLTPSHSAEVAQLMARQRNLRHIGITAKNLQDKDFECVARFTDLDMLGIDALESKHLHGSFLRGAVGHTLKLDSLYLLNFNLNAEACQSIGRLKSLETLNLTGSSLTSEFEGSLAGLPLLRNLEINETLVDDQFGATLATLTKLTDLKVKGTLLTAAGLEALEHCPALLLLETGGIRGSPKLLSCLCKCTKLRLIDVVWRGKFSAADIANFNKLPDTGYLYFEDVGDEEADYLRQCEHLTGLDIHSRRMTLAGVRSLMQMADLRHLKLDGQAWGPELVDVLYESQTLETVKILGRLWEWWEFEDLRVGLGAK